MAKKKALSYEALRKQRKAAAAEVVARIKPLLEKDPKWGLATKDKLEDEEYGLRYRAITHITKRALKLMHPDVKWSVTRGRGTAHGWVHVSVPYGQQLPDAPPDVKDVLVALGIRYSAYLPDSMPGRDEMTPCLLVGIGY